MPIMREGLILHRSSGLASPALQTGSPGTHIPWRPTPAASVPLIFPLGVTPDPRPGSRCGAASPRPRPSSLPLFLGRGMAPAHVPAPPAPESGGGGGRSCVCSREARPLSPAAPSPSHPCKPPVCVQGASRRALPAPRRPLFFLPPALPPPTPPVAHASCIRDEVSSAAAERGRARV